MILINRCNVLDKQTCNRSFTRLGHIIKELLYPPPEGGLDPKERSPEEIVHQWDRRGEVVWLTQGEEERGE